MSNYLQKIAPTPTVDGTGGTPGRPYQPGYTIFVPVDTVNRNTVPQGWTLDVFQGGNGQGGAHWCSCRWGMARLSGPSRSTSRRKRAQSPSRPSRQLQPVPPSLPVYAPPNWDAGAVSLGSLDNDGDFTCKVDNGVGGVVVGFSGVPTVDPKSIAFGLYCHNGVAQAFENSGGPTVLGAVAPYVATDVWIVRRRRGVCTLLKNGTVIYTGTSVVMGTVSIQASLYAKYDTVREAALTVFSSGAVAGVFPAADRGHRDLHEESRRQRRGLPATDRGDLGEGPWVGGGVVPLPRR